MLGVVYSSVNFLGMQSAMAAMPVVGAERLVYYREQGAAPYSVLAYGLALAAVELPWVLLQVRGRGAARVRRCCARCCCCAVRGRGAGVLRDAFAARCVFFAACALFLFPGLFLAPPGNAAPATTAPPHQHRRRRRRRRLPTPTLPSNNHPPRPAPPKPKALLFVPTLYFMVAFEAAAEAFLHYLLTFFISLMFYSVFGQTLVWCVFFARAAARPAAGRSLSPPAVHHDTAAASKQQRSLVGVFSHHHHHMNNK